MTEHEHSLVDRLGEAIEVWLQRRGQEQATSGPARPELEEFLEPLLAAPEDATLGADALGTDELGTLGEYRLLREIGRGGMGIVYEAEQSSLRRHVALKVLPERHAASPQRIERFRREASAAAKLRHPGIVPIHDFGVSDERYWIAMELVEGHSLAELLGQARSERYRERASKAGSRLRRSLGVFEAAPAVGPGFAVEAARIGAALASALAHAHASGVLHRDVKPHNVLAHAGHVYLVDFGLAKHDDDPSLSLTGDFAGTPHYASPEQIEGRRDLDARSDVYSLGVVLYELLTLRRPFEAESQQALLWRILHEEPLPPRRLEQAIPEGLERIVLTALEKDRARRYRDMAALHADLERFLAGERLRARRRGPVQRLLRTARRRPALTAALLLIALLLLGGPSAWLLQSERARRQIERERTRVQQLLDASVESQRALEAERERARAARAQAEDFLVRMRSVVDRMLDRAADMQEYASPELQRLYAALTDEALAVYAQMLVAWPEDAGVAITAATAYHLAARIRERLGQSDAALANYAQALELFARHRALPSASLGLGDALSDRAGLLARLGRGDEAKADLEHAVRTLAEQKTRERTEPLDPDAVQRLELGLLQARANLASIAIREPGAAATASEAFAEVLQELEQWPEALRNSLAGRRKEADLRNNYGALLVQTRQLDAALVQLERALTLRASLLAEEASTPRDRRLYGQSLDNVAVALLRNDPARAIELLGRAVALFDDLATRYPAEPAFANDFVRSSLRLGMQFALGQEYENAGEHFRRAHDVARRLAARFPGDTEHRRVFAEALGRLAQHELALGQREQGLALAREAFAEGAGLVESAPRHFRTQNAMMLAFWIFERATREHDEHGERAAAVERMLAARRLAPDLDDPRRIAGPPLLELHLRFAAEWAESAAAVRLPELVATILRLPGQNAETLARCASLHGRAIATLSAGTEADRLRHVDALERSALAVLGRLVEADPARFRQENWDFLAARPELAALRARAEQGGGGR